MSIDLNALATWSYDAGLLRKLSAPTAEYKIDIKGNEKVDQALRAQQWLTTGSKQVYSSRAEDWIERRIRWDGITRDPPVIEIEAGINKGDFVKYTIYPTEEAPDYKDILESMAGVLNDGVVKGFTATHVRNLVESLGKVQSTSSTQLSASTIESVRK